MALHPRSVAASTVFVALAGLALWPPRFAYWRGLAASIGGGITLVVVCLLALGLSAAFWRVTGVAVRVLALGGTAAYLLGMAAIEATLTPDGPVHFVWYAVLATCLVGGAALRERVSHLHRYRERSM